MTRKGYIYAIYVKDRLLYIGSCWDMIERIKTHKKDYKRYNNILYSYIELLKDEWYSVEFKVLKQDEYCCLDERLMEEREYIDCIGWDNLLNVICPYMTDEELKDRVNEYNNDYYEDNKNKLIKYQKTYYDYNKIKIKEKKKQPFHCPCGSIIRISGKSEHIKSLKHQEWLKNNSIE